VYCSSMNIRKNEPCPCASGKKFSECHGAAAETAPAPVAAASPKPAPTKSRRPRGFAAMDPTLVSSIARKGGKAAHRAGTAHEFTTEEAREAGRKGGRATHLKRQGGSTPSE
jgi:general stress protein YciG